MLHRELAGMVKENAAEAERLHEAMKHVEAVIKLLNPAHKINRIAIRRRKPNPLFQARDYHPGGVRRAAPRRKASYGPRDDAGYARSQGR